MLKVGVIFGHSIFFSYLCVKNKKHKTMDKITFTKPKAVIFEGVLCNRTVFVTEINVLKSGKASFVYNKEGERFNYEFLDEDSKKLIDKLVERNKKYL